MKKKKIRSRFGQSRIFDGIEVGQFAGIPAKDREAILLLMARISEASFRRGIHHSRSCLRPIKLDLFRLRYTLSLDKSFSPHGPGFCRTTGSTERLFREFGGDPDLFRECGLTG